MMPTNLNDRPETNAGQILVCLPELTDDAYNATLDAIMAAFPSEQVLVASHSTIPSDTTSLTIVPYKTARTELGWVLTAADYRAAADTALEHGADTVVLLSNTAASTNAALLRELAACVHDKKMDFAVPQFALGPNDGLVNAALFYPLTRALYGTSIHVPLPVEAAFSVRMAQRFTAAKAHQAGTQTTFLWPIAEAATAGLSVREIATDAPPPVPPDGDFNALFHSLAGSLFADIEARATFWQRARAVISHSSVTPVQETTTEVSAKIESMIENFHLAQANLQEIWSLVLPPQTRLELKRLSQLPSNAFVITPSLWARIVYDFVLAFHLRTLNRGHLLGAMTPLYFAWVASHLRRTNNDAALAAQSHEQTAAAFETEKSYLVSRWRWPDRFNP